jgi:hypothetical protein
LYREIIQELGPMSATLARRRLPFSMLAFAVIFLIGAGNVGLFMLQRQVSRLRQESRYYADQTGLHMAEHWNPDLLIEQATPELRARLKEDDVKVLSRQLEGLGRLWMYLGAKGHLNNGYWAALGGTASAYYVAKASYAAGVVAFDLELVKRDGRWQIDQFHVDLLNIQEDRGSG